MIESTLPQKQNFRHTSRNILQLFWYFPLLLYSHNISFWFSGPNSLCRGRPDGNYDLTVYSVYYPNYFLSCSDYIAYCRPCAPAYPPLVYSQVCDQCLSANNAGKWFLFDKHNLFTQIVLRQHELFLRYFLDLHSYEVLDETSYNTWLQLA